jgi:hypothetical protein
LIGCIPGVSTGSTNGMGKPDTELVEVPGSVEESVREDRAEMLTHRLITLTSTQSFSMFIQSRLCDIAYHHDGDINKYQIFEFEVLS